MNDRSKKHLRLRLKPLYDEACAVCNFKLLNPIASFEFSDLALYNDARFRGRSILALREHYDTWEDIPPKTLHSLIDDSQKSVQAIRKATGCARVNIAMLGNKVPHVHLHLIPRFPEEERYPDSASWRDPRPLQKMDPELTKEILLAIKDNIYHS